MGKEKERRFMVSSPKMLDPVTVDALRGRIRGRLLRDGEPGYDEARHVFNAMIDRRPALIVQPANAEDVRRAVLFAREQGLPLAVKGGGHNVAGTAVCEEGLMLDLSALKAVAVDPARRVAVADPGLLLSDLDRATQAFGLATPLGVVSMTGIAGLTLGGGLGWLNGKHGLACDNLLAVQIVTADGQLLTASADEHPDLFWAVRGGSGNFGVVTSFTYRLHPLGPVLAGGLAFPPERARETLRFYHEFANACPDELSMTAGIGLDAAGRPVVGVGVCWCGPLDAGERAVQPLRLFGPVEDSVGPMAYCDLQTANDGGFPSGRHHYWKASWLTDLNDEAIDVLLDFAKSKPSPATGIGLQQMHGAAARIDPTATAFPHRRSQYDLLILSQWDDPAGTERNVAWTRDLFAAVRPFAERAVYVNDLGEEEADRVHEAYGGNYDRLAAIKAAYDPDNVFRANQNVAPTA
jgi:FAD/FMN-containing dehydrogenase